MPIQTFSNKNPWRHRRFWRLFRREKPLLIDIDYSYQYMTRFPRLPITVPPLVPTLMSYRWNDDDDCDISPKKIVHNQQQQQQQQQQEHIRRRFSKRYSDIVGPSSAKIYLPRKDSTIRQKQTIVPSSSSHKHPRTSFKRNNTEGLYIINSHNKKSGEIPSSVSKNKKYEQSLVTRRYSSKNKRISTTNAVDILAQRMQAAMSTELMHSLDRNFVFGDKKSTLNGTNVNRSQSFHISIQPTNDWLEKSIPKSNYHHMIPRVKICLEDELKSNSLDEPTPDYDEQEEIIIQPIKNDEIGEEPTVDYDEVKSSSTYEPEETSPTPYDLGVSSSFIAPFTSITPSSDISTQNQSPIPPTPPPLPNTIIEQQMKITTFRCRTIADKITPNHKLILKDETDIKTKNHLIEEKQSVSQTSENSRSNPTNTPKPYRLHLSKELLEKTTLRKVSHPISRSYSTYGSISQFNDNNTESTTFCRKTSTIDEQPLDGLSSSATTSIVIENEYEHRTSSKIYNDYKQRASLISVPITNTLNNTYSQSAIIHPMHTHIGLRSSTSSSSTNDKPSETTLSNKQVNICVINQLNQHLTTRFRKQQQQQQQEICFKKDINTIEEDTHNQSNDEKTNVYDEPHNLETSKTISTQYTDLPISSVPPPPPPLPIGGFRPVQSCPLSSQRTSVMTLPNEMNSTGTSTTSSKLSDTRILRELRTNPLFTKAKQHLEIIEPEKPQSNPYLTLDRCSMETFLMRPDELNKPKDISINSQSELEVIFQKRAQRNLT